MTQPSSSSTTFAQKLYAILKEHEFVLLIICGILCAKIYPQFGVKYLYPEITATYIAVIIIFILAGLGLQTSELYDAAFANIRFNVTIQCFSFFFVSMYIYGVCHFLLYKYHIIRNTNLLDGMIICSCLPMAINTVIVITKSGHGDDAAAIFNCAFANLIGVFISPFLILVYLGIHGTMNPIDVFIKLSLRVLLPVFIGQILQRNAYVETYIVSKYKSLFKQLQQYCLVFIVYTVFCSTFLPKEDDSIASENLLSSTDVIVMMICQLLLLLSVMVIAWYVLGYLFPIQPKLRVMGFVGCTFKTVAVGVPLVNAMYASTAPELVALYTLPLLVWHPMQLIIGSMVAPYLAKYVDSEIFRLSEGLSSATAPNAIANETTSLLPASGDKV